MAEATDTKALQFEKYCKLLNSHYEYRGWTGKEKWAVISELSEKELLEKYADELTPYIPM